MHFNTHDLTGKIYGRLTVISQADNIGCRIAWLCHCECGRWSTVVAHSLLSGTARSCGCLRRELSSKRMMSHGYARRWQITPEFRVWARMLRRCNYSRGSSYYRYGGRGISVCDRWSEFMNFFMDMGPRPSSKHSIDRINNDGNYEPGNCRWATQKEQCQNTSKVRIFTVNGRSQTVSAWGEEYGIKRSTIYARLKRGLSIEQALKLAD